MQKGSTTSVRKCLLVTAAGIGANMFLAAVKITAGLIGNSYALIADGIESTTDVFSSLVTWTGVRIAAIPADDDHPYGHGKAESIAGAIVAAALIGAAVLMVFQSVREIITPHHAPAWFTLPVLVGVVAIKETLYRLASNTGKVLGSTAMKCDAWHHRSDAITSAAAFVGIGVALAGGPGYESADDWAALAACAIIAFNGYRLLRTALDEIMDAAVSSHVHKQICDVSHGVAGVVRIEKCRIRKSGFGLLVDIHVEVDGDISVKAGHRIAHEVSDRLKASSLRVKDVLVHIEPATAHATSAPAQPDPFSPPTPPPKDSR